MLFVYLFFMNLFFMTPKPAVMDLQLTQDILETSVVIHAKEEIEIPATFFNDATTRWGMIGCSGTYIDSFHILTAAHCFEYPNKGIWVRGPNEKSKRVFLMSMDSKRDLAVLWVPSLTPHRFALLSKTVRLGEGAYSVGSPMGLEFLISEGIVSKLGDREKEFSGTYLIHTGMINSGSSGGGVFNSRGELLGVNTLTIGGGFGWNGISLAVDTKTIKEFLK